jgi:very-short-patch-repair endonuclease
MKSPAETLLAVQLEQAGIPFEREYRFHPGRRWRADFHVDPRPSPQWWADAPLLIEIDGGSWLPKGRHTTGKGFAADCEKMNAAAELGYRVLRYVPAQIESGEALEQIRRILSIKEEAA